MKNEEILIKKAFAEDNFNNFLAKMYAGAIANMIIDYFSEKKNIDTKICELYYDCYRLINQSIHRSLC